MKFWKKLFNKYQRKYKFLDKFRQSKAHSNKFWDNEIRNLKISFKYYQKQKIPLYNVI